MKLKTLALAALVTLLPLAACGDDDDSPTVAGSDGDATTTTTAADPDGEVPQAIVSLSPSSTEILFAIGAGDQVIAVDDQSDYPPEAPTTDLSAYEPNVEAIASYEPDLVVSSSSDPALLDGLEALGIEVLVHEAAVEITDVYDQITELGDVTGHADEAQQLAEEMSGAVAEFTTADRDLTAYWELDPTYYSVTSNTFIGKLLGLVGITSIADEAQAEANDYPQLSAEFIVQADPDLIILADTECCQQDAATVAARDGWAGMKAVTNGNVVELSDDIASRWGPRIIELLEILDAATTKAAAA